MFDRFFAVAQAVSKNTSIKSIYTPVSNVDFLCHRRQIYRRDAAGEISRRNRNIYTLTCNVDCVCVCGRFIAVTEL